MMTLVTTSDIPKRQRFAFWREAVCSHFSQVDCFFPGDRPFSGEIATSQIKEASFSRVRGRGYRCARTSRHIRQDSEDVLFVSLQMRGTWSASQDGREVQLWPGDLSCFDSTRPFSGMQSDYFDQFVFQVPRELWGRRGGQTEHLTARAVHGNTPMGALVFRTLPQIASVVENVEPASAYRLLEASLELVTAAFGDLISQRESEKSSGRVALLYRAKMLIEERLHDPELNTEKVARTLRISLRYLQELFKGEQTTVSNWIWERRLERSRCSLSDPLLANKSVSQIAFDCGFSNFSHFSNRFRAAFAMTPSEFRRERLVDRPLLAD